MHQFNKKRIIRFGLYIIGLLIMACGVVLSVKCKELGASPINTIPLAVSIITGISIGDCVTCFFVFLAILQIAVLGRDYKLIHLLQIPVAVIFGKTVNAVKLLMNGFNFENYFVQLVVLFISIFLLGAGIFLVISVGIMPLPPDGLTLALAKKMPHCSFQKIKIVQDCIVVLLAVTLSLVFTGQLEGIREGTVISALLSGKIIFILQKHVGVYIHRLCIEQ